MRQETEMRERAGAEAASRIEVGVFEQDLAIRLVNCAE